MNGIKRVVPNITSNRLEASVAFYTEFLGFRVAMDMGWIVTVVSPNSSTAQISLVRGQPSQDMSIVTLSIEVDDVDSLHDAAMSLGYEIVYPITDEPWGLRRFHVKDPTGVTINVMCHNSSFDP
jgi:predicted enzyme related to lactoylglutathione lyase